MRGLIFGLLVVLLVGQAWAGEQNYTITKTESGCLVDGYGYSMMITDPDSQTGRWLELEKKRQAELLDAGRKFLAEEKAKKAPAPSPTAVQKVKPSPTEKLSSWIVGDYNAAMMARSGAKLLIAHGLIAEAQNQEYLRRVFAKGLQNEMDNALHFLLLYLVDRGHLPVDLAGRAYIVSALAAIKEKAQLKPGQAVNFADTNPVILQVLLYRALVDCKKLPKVATQAAVDGACIKPGAGKVIPAPKK